MQQLSGLDAAFLYMETPNAPMHVSSLAIYDPEFHIRLSALAARSTPSLASALWKVRLDDFRAMSSQLSSTLGDKTPINDLALTVFGGALHH